MLHMCAHTGFIDNIDLFIGIELNVNINLVIIFYKIIIVISKRMQNILTTLHLVYTCIVDLSISW